MRPRTPARSSMSSASLPATKAAACTSSRCRNPARAERPPKQKPEAPGLRSSWSVHPSGCSSRSSELLRRQFRHGLRAPSVRCPYQKRWSAMSTGYCPPHHGLGNYPPRAAKRNEQAECDRAKVLVSKEDRSRAPDRDRQTRLRPFMAFHMDVTSAFRASGAVGPSMATRSSEYVSVLLKAST